MPFGWALAPWWANKFNKPIRTWMNQAQVPHCWWIDDVLLLGESATQVEHRAIAVVKMLTSLGIHVNQGKSMQHAAQQFPYVGHQFNLQTNVVEPLPHKQTISHNLCKHQLKGWTFQPKNLAALAGNLADTAKPNMSLHGLPQQIMKAAAWGVLQNTKLGWNKARCWEHQHPNHSISKGYSKQHSKQ